MILVDSNVLIDVFDRDPVWHDWSFAQLRESALDDELAVTQIVVGEVGPRYASLAEFEAVLASLDIGIAALTHEAAFAAGVAFRRFCARREGRTSILADFVIGGHAQAMQARIMTRDARIFSAYFADIDLITPSKDLA